MSHFNIQRGNYDAGLRTVHAVGFEFSSVVFRAIEQVFEHAGVHAK